MSAPSASRASPMSQGLHTYTDTPLTGTDLALRPIDKQIMKGNFGWSCDAQHAVILTSDVTITMNEETVNATINHRIAPRTSVPVGGAAQQALVLAPPAQPQNVPVIRRRAKVAGAVPALAQQAGFVRPGDTLGASVANAYRRSHLTLADNRAVAPETAYGNELLPYEPSYKAKIESAIYGLSKTVVGNSFDLAALAHYGGIALAATAGFNVSMSIDDLWTLFNVGVADRTPARVVTKDFAPYINTAAVYLTRPTYTTLGALATAVLNVLVVASGGMLYVDAVSFNEDGTVHSGIQTIQQSNIVTAFNAVMAFAEQNNVRDYYRYVAALGYNKVLSVIGETDEGAWARDMFRQIHFGSAVGIINIENTYSLTEVINDTAVTRSYVYRELLALAASMSASDPLLAYEGKQHVPTLFVFEEESAEYGALVDTPYNIWLDTDEGVDLIRRGAAILNTVLSDTTHLDQRVANDADATASALLTSILTRTITASRVNGLTAATLTLGDFFCFIVRMCGHIVADTMYRIGTISIVDFAAVAGAAVAVRGVYTNIGTYINTHAYVAYDPTRFLEHVGKYFTIHDAHRYFAKAFIGSIGSSGSTCIDMIARSLGQGIQNYSRRVLLTYERNPLTAFGSRHFGRRMLSIFSWIEPNGIVPRTVEIPMVQRDLIFTQIGVATTFPAFNGEFSSDSTTGDVSFGVQGGHNMRNLHIANFYRSHILDGIGEITSGRTHDGHVISDNLANVESGMYRLSQLTWSLSEGHAFPHSTEMFVLNAATQYRYPLVKKIVSVRNNNTIINTTRNHMYSPYENKEGANKHGVFTRDPPKVTYNQGPFTYLGTAQYRGVNRADTHSNARLDRVRAVISFTDNARSVSYDYNHTLSRYTFMTVHDQLINVLTKDGGHAPHASSESEGSDDSDGPSNSDSEDDLSDIDTDVDVAVGASGFSARTSIAPSTRIDIINEHERVNKPATKAASVSSKSDVTSTPKSKPGAAGGGKGDTLDAIKLTSSPASPSPSRPSPQQNQLASLIDNQDVRTKPYKIGVNPHTFASRDRTQDEHVLAHIAAEEQRLEQLRTLFTEEALAKQAALYQAAQNQQPTADGFIDINTSTTSNQSEVLEQSEGGKY